MYGGDWKGLGCGVETVWGIRKHRENGGKKLSGLIQGI